MSLDSYDLQTPKFALIQRTVWPRNVCFIFLQWYAWHSTLRSITVWKQNFWFSNLFFSAIGKFSTIFFAARISTYKNFQCAINPYHLRFTCGSYFWLKKHPKPKLLRTENKKTLLTIINSVKSTTSRSVAASCKVRPSDVTICFWSGSQRSPENFYPQLHTQV